MNENGRICEQLFAGEAKARHRPGLWLCGSIDCRTVYLGLLHGALVSLDHFLDHLAADAAGFTGGQIAVVALLQVDADLP